MSAKATSALAAPFLGVLASLQLMAGGIIALVLGLLLLVIGRQQGSAQAA